jgi:hypothetical protein
MTLEVIPTKPYLGENMSSCPSRMLQWSSTSAIILNGSPLNICGHQALRVGAYYFQILRVHGFPTYMNEKGYRLRLAQTGQREVRRDQIFIRDPERAQAKLTELMAKRWLWGILAHNCANFVAQIIEAGGAPRHLYSQCPRLPMDPPVVVGP